MIACCCHFHSTAKKIDTYTPGGGGGGVLRISSYEDDQKREKAKPQKFLDQKLTPKNPWRISKPQKFAECMKFNTKNKNITNWLFVFVCLFIIPSESSYCFEYPKKSYLNQATLKNTCKIYLPQNIPESKISNPKNPRTGSHNLERGTCMCSWRFHGPVYFWNGFGSNLEYRIKSPRNQSEKPTDLKMIIFAF